MVFVFILKIWLLVVFVLVLFGVVGYCVGDWVWYVDCFGVDMIDVFVLVLLLIFVEVW